MKRVWLEELYRQWSAARGNRATPRSRAFRRKWPELLDAAGLHSAEDQKSALRQAEQEERAGHVRLHRLRARGYFVQTIDLPLDAEPWLLALFQQRQPSDCLGASLKVVARAAAQEHERFPKLWKDWCQSLLTAFRLGKNVRPLYWRSPENVEFTLALIHRLTSLAWKEGALIREVSIEIGLTSKVLERHQRGVEACLALMFGRPMPLESLGIVLTDSRSDLAGILTLHYRGGEIQVFNELKAVYGLSLSDLDRAERATTPALRLLTVENSKTTLRRLASVNEDGLTLMAACSFPSRALLRLLAILPSELPVFHFGDTDPAGYLILSKLRTASGRPIQPFLMGRRSSDKACPLSEYDQSILPRLLNDPHLKDLAAELRAIKDSGCKGDFEQETIGLPDLTSWPFYSLEKRLS
jgi:hypothetical protein